MCKFQGCDKPAYKGSSYCQDHKKAAREAWKVMIAEQAAERAGRYDGFASLWSQAYEAGIEAIKSTVCTPMVVTNGDQSWVVKHGECGYAAIIIRPGNSSLAAWAKKSQGFVKSYHGGVSKGIAWEPRDAGLPGTAVQSYELNGVFANAFAEVFRQAGFKMSVWRHID